jgi:hypothetical protein
MYMETKDFREAIGAVKFEEMVQHVKHLRAEGRSPDEIGEALRTRFPEAVGPAMKLVFVLIGR